ELHSRTKPRLALNLVPAAGEQSALVQSQQAEVAGQPIALRDNESTSVVLYQAVQAAIVHSQREPHSRGRSVLLDVGHRLGELPEQHRAKLVRQIVGHVQVQLDLRTRERFQHPYPLTDRLDEAARDLERGRANFEEQPAERLLGLQKKDLSPGQELRVVAVGILQTL